MHARVVEANTRQINSELSASYSYLAMSAFCERRQFTGAQTRVALSLYYRQLPMRQGIPGLFVTGIGVAMLPLGRQSVGLGEIGKMFGGKRQTRGVKIGIEAHPWQPRLGMLPDRISI